MTLGSRRATKAAAVMGLFIALGSGCSDSKDSVQGPNADATHLFPRTFSARGFIHSGRLVRATAVTATTKSYTFKVDEDQPFSLVANCTSGRISASLGGEFVSSCKHGLTPLVGFCAGQRFTVAVEVAADQPRNWGVALYRNGSC
ncbi:MAG: hypothetical protein ACXVGR_15990 [Mycobacteriaceae bacterium]